MNTDVRWKLQDMFELVAACALIGWVLSWTCWELRDRLLLACLELAFLGVSEWRSRRKPAAYLRGLSVARFTGATLVMAWGAVLAVQWWPSAAPTLITSYGRPLENLIIALALLVPLGVAGGVVAGQAYRGLGDLGCALLAAWSKDETALVDLARPLAKFDVSKPSARLFRIRRWSVLLLRGFCLLIVFSLWWFSAEPIQISCRLPLEDPLSRPWALTADGRRIGYLEESGTLRFHDIDTGRLVDTVELRLSAPPRRAGRTTWSKQARRMWFLPGGKQLMLDCWPYRYTLVSTRNWQELSAPWNARDGFLVEPVRGVSSDGRMIVTSPDHRNYEMQNNTTLTMWDTTKQAPHRKITIRPSQSLWVIDDTILVSDHGNAITLQTRRGTKPGGGVAVWLLDTGKRRSLDLGSFPEAVSPDGRRIASFHYVFDSYTGEVQERPGQPIGFAANGARLFVEGEELTSGGLPVIGSAVTWLLERRLLVFNGSGSRILGFSGEPPLHDAVQLQQWRLSSDGRCAVGVLEGTTAELLVFKLP